jgi:ribulose 1,5-bisphosphate carboxylase large subunit-like protein
MEKSERPKWSKEKEKNGEAKRFLPRLPFPFHFGGTSMLQAGDKVVALLYSAENILILVPDMTVMGFNGSNVFVKDGEGTIVEVEPHNVFHSVTEAQAAFGVQATVWERQVAKRAAQQIRKERRKNRKKQRKRRR